MADDNRERYIQKLFEQAEIARYSESERRQYEESKKIFWDNYSVLKTAEQKGLQKGRAEGEHDKAVAIARNLKALGFSLADIEKTTGLTEEAINQL